VKQEFSGLKLLPQLNAQLATSSASAFIPSPPIVNSSARMAFTPNFSHSAFTKLISSSESVAK
jgi:hypothetical protein